MLKGVDHGFFLSDPYFYPLYKRAEELDLTIVVHQGAAREHIEGLGISSYKVSMAHNLHYAATVMKAFYAVLESDLYERFPKLRFAFVESGASWVPFAFHHFQRMRAAQRAESFLLTPKGPTRQIVEMDPKEEMRKRNMFVAAETDEDIPYLVSILGEDNIMMGTDMCHNDNGSDPLAHTALMEREDIDIRVRRKIADTNGRRAFNIPDDFTPTANVTAEDIREVDLAIL
ncbi:MAG: amidohydrolase family protein [Micavibrio sp.]|nr:amidohydrolase family protein [Micavibrio sp.]